MKTAQLCFFIVFAGAVACSELVQPAEGGGSTGGAPTDGGAPSDGGAPGCDYGEFVERLRIDEEWIASGTPTGQCAGLPLTADANGQVSCILIEGRADMPAGCTAQGRTPARAELLEQVMASEGFDPTWTSICEIVQLSGAAREECIQEVASSTPGFCFVSDDTVVIGNPDLTDACSVPQQMLKLSGDVVTPEVRVFSFCDDTPPPCP